MREVGAKEADTHDRTRWRTLRRPLLIRLKPKVKEEDVEEASCESWSPGL